MDGKAWVRTGVAAVLSVAWTAFAGEAALLVDFSKSLGKVKPVHGVGQPPILGDADYSMFHYLKAANVPFSRTHDVNEPFGGFVYVDVGNVFPVFDEDENDPANYDFRYTDKLFKALLDNGVEPFFRLGATIENPVAAGFGPVRILPPKDFAKWGRICSRIVAHCNKGWANGHKWNVRHWEIWNEPDLDNGDFRKNQCWYGTFGQFLEFYAVAASVIKRDHPEVKVGGAGLTGFYSVNAMSGDPESWAHAYDRGGRFVAFCAERKVPLDFLSFHCYQRPYAARPQIRYVRKLLDLHGLAGTELALTEWNYVDWVRNPHAGPGAPRYVSGHDGAKHAAYNAAMLLMMQNEAVDVAHFYDARVKETDYTGLFDPATRTPRRTYHGFRFFGELYRLGTAVPVEFDERTAPGVWVAAAKGADGRGAVMIVNQAACAYPLKWKLLGGKKFKSCHLVDADHRGEECAPPVEIGPFSILFMNVQ